MSRKQYEQIQSALNQMNSIERQQERHNSSMEDGQMQNIQGQIELKSQINNA